MNLTKEDGIIVTGLQPTSGNAGLSGSTSTHDLRLVEKKALLKLLSASKRPERRQQLSAEDLKAKVEQARLERVFAGGARPSQSPLSVFKKELSRAKTLKPSHLRVRRARKLFKEVSVPVTFTLAVATMIVTCLCQIESQAYAAQAMDSLSEGDDITAYGYLKKSLIWNPYNMTASLHCARIDQERKELKSAYCHVERALKADPDNQQLLDRKGVLALTINRFADARDAYSRLLNNPAVRRKPHYFANRARALSELLEFDKAVDDYSSLLRMRRDDRNALLGRAFCFSRTGERQEALKDLHRIIEKNPGDYDAFILAARCQAESGSEFLDAAIDTFRKAIAVRPDESTGYLLLAGCLNQKGDREAALAALDTAIALNEKCFEAHALKGNILLSVGRNHDAYAELEALSSASDRRENFQLLLDRSRAAQAVGAHQEARAILTKLIALKPDRSDLYVQRALASRARGQLKVAVRDLEQAVRLEPKNCQAILAKAACQAQLGRTDLAEADYRAAIAANPSDALPYIEFGKFQMQRKLLVSARDCFQKASSLDGDNEEARSLYAQADGWLNKLAGEAPVFEDAFAVSRRELSEIARSDFAGLLAKGWKAMKDGKIAFAEKALARAVQLDPDSIMARRYFATTLMMAGKARAFEAQIIQLARMGAGLADDKLKVARVLLKSKDLSRAVMYLEAHLASRPQDVKALMDLAGAYAELGNTGKSIETLKQAMTLATSKKDYNLLHERLLSLKETEERAIQEKARQLEGKDREETQS